jgi:two-component system, OmpR family, sensor histidine kinase ArlS
MRIRNKILFYFSSTIIFITGVSLIIIYLLFAAFREEVFQQQQHDKIKQTIEFIQEFEKMNENIASAMDQLSINDFYDEKLLVYNQNKQLIFSSLDNLSIERKNELLNELSPAKQWIETKDGDYDLIGVYLEKDNESFYAISKAYDANGYTKKNFLGNVLIIIFVFISLVVIIISLYLSSIISKPIASLVEKIKQYDLSKINNKLVHINTTTLELQELMHHYNQLLKRTEEAFEFQKRSIRHISHELKTPLAIMVSELESINSQELAPEMKSIINEQIIRAKSLGTIINSLLQLSKLDAGQTVDMQNIRIDELIFDTIEKAKNHYPHFHFDIQYATENIDENCLTINGNRELLMQVFHNLVINCIHYSNEDKASIHIYCVNKSLSIHFTNDGTLISDEEKPYLFTHFFRGSNSKNKPGFGIGLELSKNILAYHHANIIYDNSNELNNFIINWN